MINIFLVTMGCLGSFWLGRAAIPRGRPHRSWRTESGRTESVSAELDLVHAQVLIGQLRNDIAGLPATIYAADPRLRRAPIG